MKNNIKDNSYLAVFKTLCHGLLITFPGLFLLAGHSFAAGDSFAGRVLAAEFYPGSDNRPGSLAAVFQVTRQGNNSLMSADPANLVGSIIAVHCDQAPARALQDAALLLTTNIESERITDVDMELSAVDSAIGVPSFRIRSLHMPFLRNQPPMHLTCGD